MEQYVIHCKNLSFKRERLIGYRNYNLLIKKYSNTNLNSPKKTPTQASKKSNKKVVYIILRDNREIKKAKIKFLVEIYLEQLILEKVIVRGNTDWSHKLYTKTEVIHETIPSYRIDYLPERYNEHLFRSTELTPNENNQD